MPLEGEPGKGEPGEALERAWGCLSVREQGCPRYVTRWSDISGGILWTGDSFKNPANCSFSACAFLLLFFFSLNFLDLYSDELKRAKECCVYKSGLRLEREKI